jgi:RHS repeat-associated protein
MLMKGLTGVAGVLADGASDYDGLAGYTGKLRDNESGLDFFGARYFSGAWSAVPAPVPYANPADPQTLNLYAYVRNNPLARADLDGHAVHCSGKKASGVGCQFLAYWNAQHGLTFPKAPREPTRTPGNPHHITIQSIQYSSSGRIPKAGSWMIWTSYSLLSASRLPLDTRNNENEILVTARITA